MGRGRREEHVFRVLDCEVFNGTVQSDVQVTVPRDKFL